MELKNIFNGWAKSVDKTYTQKQWLLSKWEVTEGIDWSKEKIDAMIENIADSLRLDSSTVFIDLGCGGGWILSLLKKYSSKVYGLDISQNMLGHASTMGHRDNLVCAEIGKLPLQKDSFDRALSYFVFLNFKEDVYVEHCLREIFRILKPQGRALVGQLADKAKSKLYDHAKTEYLNYCKKAFSLGINQRDAFPPPIKLFERKAIFDFLKKENIKYEVRDAFNPFYRRGQPKTVQWRFDIILKK